MPLNNSINTPPPFLVASGGTGITSYTIGDLLYASGTTALSKLADVATGNALISGGVGVAPSWGKIGLTTHVSGILPVANGGTGTSTAFTQGSVVFAGASGVYSQDNANLFWDDTNNYLGIGTNSPFNALTVIGNSAIGVGIYLSNSNASGETFITIASSASKGAYISCGSGTNTWSFGAVRTDGNFYLTTGTGSLTNVIAANYTTSDVTISSGNLAFGTQGKGLQIRTGATASRMGTATLAGLTTTISNTSVTANTYIILSRKTATGTLGTLRIGTVVAGTSFQILSVAGDTSQVYWLMIEPLP